MFFTGFLVAMVANCVKIITKTYLAIILLSKDTMLLSLLSVTKWFNKSLTEMTCTRALKLLKGPLYFVVVAAAAAAAAAAVVAVYSLPCTFFIF